MGYALSQAVSTALIGCSTPEEVEQNAAELSGFQPLSPELLRQLEERVNPFSPRYSYFKRGAAHG